MTVSTSISSRTYAGTGSEFAFPTWFEFFSPQDIEVVERIVSTGVETTKALTTDYTVSGGLGAAGTVTAIIAPPNTVTWTIRRALAETQETALPVAGSLPSSSVEQMVDRVVMMIQQHSEEIARSLLLPVTSSLTDLTIPDPIANNLLGWNAGATNLENKLITDASTTVITPFAADLLDDANAAAGQATLGLIIGTDIPALSAADLRGIKHLFISAAAMRPTVNTGCSFLTDVETTNDRPDLKVLDFDTAVEEHAQFQIPMPDSWDKGTIKFQYFWTVSAAVSTGVAFRLELLAAADNESIDTAWTSTTAVADDAQGATEELLVSPESTALTVSVVTAALADQMMIFARITREVGHANDDMTQDARLIGIRLIYTTDAGNDA